MFNFMKKAAEKDDKEKRKREKKERKDVKKRDRSSMSAEELLRLDEVNAKNSAATFIERYSRSGVLYDPFPFSYNCKTTTDCYRLCYFNYELR